MGGSENDVAIISQAGVDEWPRMSKEMVSRKLAQRIAEAIA